MVLIIVIYGISPKKKNNISKIDTNNSNIWNALSPSRKSQSFFNSCINSSDIEKKPSINKNNIKKGSSLNDSNLNLLIHNDSQKNSENSVKRAQSNFVKKQILEVYHPLLGEKIK